MINLCLDSYIIKTFYIHLSQSNASQYHDADCLDVATDSQRMKTQFFHAPRRISYNNHNFFASHINTERINAQKPNSLADSKKIHMRDPLRWWKVICVFLRHRDRFVLEEVFCNHSVS